MSNPPDAVLYQTDAGPDTAAIDQAVAIRSRVMDMIDALDDGKSDAVIQKIIASILRQTDQHIRHLRGGDKA